MVSDVDIRHMKSAISLARRGVGRVWPNPSVGCLIVKDGIVLARSRTADGGRPHAEKLVLDKVGKLAKGATLYVTLEPCAHYGKTSPCVDAIIEAGISRVAIGMIDVDPRVIGKSIERLKKAGIELVIGVLEDECRYVNAGFVKRVTESRPYVTLKTACTLDGKIACSSGESQWITGALARRHAHYVRSLHDAILIGSGTAVADDPMLTTRLDGICHKTIRIVLDRNLCISPESRLVQSANDIPLWLFYSKKCKNYDILEQSGVVLYETDDCADLKSVLKTLAEQGITRVLVEGGSAIHASFLRARLCDELLIYKAPTILGDDGISVIGKLDVNSLAHRYDFVRCSSQNIGSDMLEVYKQKVEA